MHDTHPEWGPAKHRPEATDTADRAAAEVGERPDDN